MNLIWKGAKPVDTVHAQIRWRKYKKKNLQQMQQLNFYCNGLLL